ncbi:MAG: T9SS type A sorting domain-containing protein, partial [Bacteroidota bacterium]
MIDEVIYLRDQRKVDANGNQDSLLMKVSVFQASPNLSQLNLRTEMDRFEPITTDQGRRRMHTLAVGDFDGDGLRLGPGRRFSLTDIKQPLVVLNAPPTHYDILDGTTYDINDCFGGGCNYSATYSLQSATTISASSEISRTWGVSATASAGGSYGVFEAGASITASYGEGFSQSDVESETVEISISATTNHDDMIYATVQNYTVWEYPLYEGDIIVGHVISVVPELTGQEWFPSKSYKATSFIPDHEVDNIISYREYPNDFFQDNPNVDKALKNFQTYTIDQGLSYNWSVGFNNFTENGNQSENTIGLDVSANAGVGGEGWGLSVETEANYESFEVETQTVSIDTTIQIDVVFDGIDRTIGENQYGISPFLYWSKNGALVLDYAVRPELPGGGTANNWWTLEYGQQHDPAFILPWRFDPEKGLALTDTTRRYETKSLTYWPENPKPGDKVRVTAYVHNWSLLPTNAFVDISFYIGHPLEGGQLLTDINGQTMLTTNDYIEARGRQKVEFEFYLPAGLGNFPRLYAYIDPSQQLSEIHETNNIGYVTLASFSAVSNEELQEELAQQQKWSKAYPNPFSDQFTIEYEVPGRSEISLDLLDINGRQIRQLAEAEVNPGTHKVKVLTEDLPAGMYLYRLQVGTHQEFGKLIRR